MLEIRFERIQADDQAVQGVEQPLPLVQQRAVGDQQHGAEFQVVPRRARQFLDVGAQRRLAAREENRIGFLADDAQQLDGLGGGQFLAEDVRLLLRAVGAGQIAFVRGVKNRGIGRHHVGAPNLTPVKVLEIVFEILQDKRIVLQQPLQQGQPLFFRTPFAH